MKHIPLILAALAMTSCASAIQSEIAKIEMDLARVTSADATAAIAEAKSADPVADPGAVYRAECYQAILDALPKASAAPVSRVTRPPGLAALYDLEAAMQLDAKLRGGVSLITPAIHARCAVLVTTIEQFLLRVGIRAAPMPGVGALLPGR